MRRAAGCINQLVRCLALLALAACSSARRAPEPLAAAGETCELTAIAERAIDSAVVAFRSSIVAANDCALRLVAGALRPWRGGSLEPWTVSVATAVTRDTIPTVTARRLRAAQARDALDAASVLVATEDLELVEYARARDDLAVVALPWDRLYLRVGDASSDSLGDVDPAAVRAVARRAEPLPECDTLSQPPQTRDIARSSRAVYLLGDRTGRELAERIVGLGNAKTVIGLDSAAFDTALSAGAEAAYIVSVLLTGDACGALSDLLRRAPWADRASVELLIETRAYAITRRGSAP
jgi:hypothetical protein